MKNKLRTLSILMNGMLVGHLEKSEKQGMTFFYDQKWLDTAGARPVSWSLSLVNQKFSGDVVYNFFDNLLPDNSEIRARIQAKFQVQTNQPFDLLANIGRDCVGAIQIIEGKIPVFKKKIKASPLNSREIASILQGYLNYPLGMTDTSSEFRISIAGAQEKTAFLLHNNQWCRPLEETPTSHIFKLPIGFIEHQQLDLSESCENEWLCSKIAEAFDLEVAKCEILIFDKVKVLSVERFDRKLSTDQNWLMRLPQEDICQALGVSGNLKYQSDGGPGINNIMNLLKGAVNPAKDRDNFFRAQVLFWLLAAIDGHGKNFSIFLQPEGKYSLTPLYDIMSAYPLIAKNQLQKQKIKMAMALKGANNHYHWHTVLRRHFVSAAKHAGYSTQRAESILDEMLGKVDSVIRKVSTQLPHGFPEHISTPVFEGMKFTKGRLSQK